jgi:hypothetical protein
MDEYSKSENKAKGGRARAENLSPDQRREIACKAAATRWQPIPEANYEGILRIGGGGDTMRRSGTRG